MARISSDPTGEIESLVNFAEVISQKIDAIRDNIEKTRTRLYILAIAISTGAPAGFIIARGIQGIFPIEIGNGAAAIVGGLFILFAFSLFIATVLTTLNRLKYLNRELRREQHTLASLVSLIDLELEESPKYLTMSQRALLEMRLRRVSFQ
ncbi:MAG: hypothetical protein ACO1PM_25745 [Acidovorax sp.]